MDPDTIGAILERYIPIMRTGIVTIIPAIGPLYPRSKREFLLGIGDLTLITAPNVPINVGAGTKYGKVALTSCFLAA